MASPWAGSMRAGASACTRRSDARYRDRLPPREAGMTTVEPGTTRSAENSVPLASSKKQRWSGACPGVWTARTAPSPAGIRSPSTIGAHATACARSLSRQGIFRNAAPGQRAAMGSQPSAWSGCAWVTRTRASPSVPSASARADK